MAWLGFENLALTKTIAGGGADIENLQSRIGQDRWATGVNVAGGAYFTIDSGSTGTKWRGVALFQTNLTPSASMVVKLGTSPGADDVHNSGPISGVVAGRNYLIALLAQDFTARYLRVEITDAANPDGGLQIGFVYAGPLVTTTYGTTYGSSAGLEVATSEVRTIGGQEYPRLGWMRFGWDLNFDAIKDDKVEELVIPMTSYAATGENVLFIPYSNGTKLQSQSVYGRPRQTARLSVQLSHWNANTWTFQISDRL